MTYVEVVKESIEYIEKMLREQLSLDDLSEKFYISKYHFSRIFKSVTGMSIMEYYKKRQFSEATVELLNSKKNILEIAIDFGYNSHEAFSRAYKKHTGVSPKLVKKQAVDVDLFSKFIVINREFKNYKNTILTEHKIIEKEELIFFGKRLSVKFDKFVSEKKGMKDIEEFVEKADNLNKFYVFTFMTTLVEKTLDLGMFVLESEKYKVQEKLEKIILPRGNYLEIIYNGKMQQSWKNVNSDIRMILRNKNLNIDNRVINFYQEFDKDNNDTNIYKIYVPIQ